MNWDQIRDFERHGATIGSHTRTHFDCGTDDESSSEVEIVGSKKDLCRELGHEVAYFSFPWGYPRNMSPAAIAFAKREYEFIFSAYGGVNGVPTPEDAVFRREPPGEFP